MLASSIYRSLSARQVELFPQLIRRYTDCVKSLWSTSSTFDFVNLAIVMVITSIATYVTVFNLERFVRNGHGLYSAYRRGVVDRMSADLRTQAWADRAKRFGGFEPDRRSTKPTNWYVLWASILLFLRHWRRVFWPGLRRLPAQVFRASSRNNPNDRSVDDNN